MPEKLPIYLQIRELLLRELGAGKWLQGERLPTEATLASQLGVAVGTLRKALSALEKDGILERRQGSGTYVAENHSGQAIYHFFRLEKLNGHSGMPNAEVISLEKMTHQQAAQQMKLQNKQVFWRIRRHRLLDEIVVAIEDVMLPEQRAPQLHIDQLHESLYLHYREQLGFWIANVVDAVTVGTMPDWGNNALGLDAGTPCGMVQRQSFDQHGEIAEFSLLWFNQERARYMARWA